MLPPHSSSGCFQRLRVFWIYTVCITEPRVLGPGLIPKPRYTAPPAHSHTTLCLLLVLNLPFYSRTTSFLASVLEAGSCLPVPYHIPGAAYGTYPLASFLMRPPPGTSEPAARASCWLLRSAVPSSQRFSLCFSPCPACSPSSLCLTSSCSVFRSQLSIRALD